MQALPIPIAPPNPHLTRLGGVAAVQRLVAAFYQAMDTRPDTRVLRAMHADDLSDTQAVLVLYLTEWLGGPRQYSALRGPPRLGRVHRPFAIDADARDAWMACMDQALAQVCTDAGLRDALHDAFASLATHLQNHPARQG